jgi:hypothetical protein
MKASRSESSLDAYIVQVQRGSRHAALLIARAYHLGELELEGG